MADWSALPKELLYMISLLLTTTIDLLRLRSVCTIWRAAIQPPHEPAVRMLNTPNHFLKLTEPTINDGCPVSTTYNMVSIPNIGSRGPCYLAKCTIYALQSHNTTPWIIKLVSDSTNSMHFLHLLTSSHIKHPPTFPKSFNFMDLRIKELSQYYTVVSFDSTPSGTNVDGCARNAVLLYGVDNELVMLGIERSREMLIIACKSGDGEWRNSVVERMCNWSHVNLIGGKFYAVSSRGRLVTVNHVDFSVENVVSASDHLRGNKKFLVSSNGDLFLVDLYFDKFYSDDHVYEDFDEYFEMEANLLMECVDKLEVFCLDENAREWTKVNDLGERILFVGGFCSFSASVEDIFGETSCCKGNCVVFFTRESWGFTAFDLQTGTFTRVDRIDKRLDFPLIFWPPPDWVYPAVSSIADDMCEMAIEGGTSVELQ